MNKDYTEDQRYILDTKLNLKKLECKLSNN